VAQQLKQLRKQKTLQTLNKWNAERFARNDWNGERNAERLHGTIGTVNGTLNVLHGTIGTVNGTLNGLHGTIRTENGLTSI
jgi:hypothetical protein